MFHIMLMTKSDYLPNDIYRSIFVLQTCLVFCGVGYELFISVVQSHLFLRSRPGETIETAASRLTNTYGILGQGRC